MKKPNKDNKYWPIKITFITYRLAILFSYLSQVAVKTTFLLIPLLILIFMIFTSIIADAIAVSATSADVNRIIMITKNNSKEQYLAIFIVNHAEKVNNICADVIGDMCGILSGACAATIVAKCTSMAYNYLYTICISSFIVAITVGGKAYLKDIAVNSSEEFILSIVKILKIFVRKNYVNIGKN